MIQAAVKILLLTGWIYGQASPDVCAILSASRRGGGSDRRPYVFNSLAPGSPSARDAHQLDKAIALYKQALKLKPSNWEEGLGFGILDRLPTISIATRTAPPPSLSCPR